MEKEKIFFLKYKAFIRGIYYAQALFDKNYFAAVS